MNVKGRNRGTFDPFVIHWLLVCIQPV